MQKSELIGLPVEVSGWDTEGRFFVEHSALDSTESGQKTLLLRHAVHARSFVFIRARDGDSFAKSHPEVHHVERTESSEHCGYHKLHLTDFPPRRNGGGKPKNAAEHLIGVCEEVKS